MKGCCYLGKAFNESSIVTCEAEEGSEFLNSLYGTLYGSGGGLGVRFRKGGGLLLPVQFGAKCPGAPH